MPAYFQLLFLLIYLDFFSAVIRKASKLLKEKLRLVFYIREIPGMYKITWTAAIV